MAYELHPPMLYVKFVFLLGTYNPYPLVIHFTPQGSGFYLPIDGGIGSVNAGTCPYADGPAHTHYLFTIKMYIVSLIYLEICLYLESNLLSIVTRNVFFKYRYAICTYPSNKSVKTRIKFTEKCCHFISIWKCRALSVSNIFMNIY